MTDNEHLKVFLNPLAFVPTMGTSVAGAPSDPAPESVLDFLCTPGVDSDVAALVRRCREISAEPEPLFAAPADKRILDKLVWPLLLAKGSYILGNYLGTISLCGMVSEMLAILIFEVAEPQINGAKMTEAAQREAHAFPARHGSTLQNAADGFGCVHHHGVVGMGVFERGFRIAVPEQPTDGEYGLALPQGDAGMGMAKIVKTDVVEVRLGADRKPERAQPTSTRRPSGPGRRDGPSYVGRMWRSGHGNTEAERLSAG